MDYDPAGSKSSKQVGVSVYGSKNNLYIDCNSAAQNLQLQGTADNNTIYLGNLFSPSTNDLRLESGSDNNTFVGGSVGVVSNLGTANWFSGVRGATDKKSSSANFATIGDGTANFAHGLAGTPTYVQITPSNPGAGVTLHPKSIDATNVVLELRNAAGTLITTGTYNFYIEVSL